MKLKTIFIVIIFFCCLFFKDKIVLFIDKIGEISNSSTHKSYKIFIDKNKKEYFYVYDNFPKGRKWRRKIKDTLVILPSYSYYDVSKLSEEEIKFVNSFPKLKDEEVEKLKEKRYKPYEDFKGFVDGLVKKNYRVLVIEYFGYNNSSETTRERTSENICEEIHEALSFLSLNKYILVPHSISGLYVLDYLKKYKQEVKAVISIDPSLPCYFYEEIIQQQDLKKINDNKKKREETNVIPMSFKKMHDYFLKTAENNKTFKYEDTLPVLFFITTELIGYVDSEVENKKLKTKTIDSLNNMITNNKIQKIIKITGKHLGCYKTKQESLIKEILKFLKF